MDIRGNTFIVTGGASGLGAATARMIVEAGGRAVLADLKADEGAALSRELGAAARFIATDVTDEASAQAAVAAALREFGDVHGLVNCAGIVHQERVAGKEGPHTLAGFARTVSPKNPDAAMPTIVIGWPLTMNAPPTTDGSCAKFCVHA